MKITPDQAVRHRDGRHAARGQVGARGPQGVFRAVSVDVEVGVDAFWIGKVRSDGDSVWSRGAVRRGHLPRKVDTGVEHGPRHQVRIGGIN